MSKQSIYVKHKDEILSNLVSYLDDIAGRYEAVQSDYESGYITALKWVLGIDKTQEQKDQEFSDKIDKMTKFKSFKGDSNE